MDTPATESNQAQETSSTDRFASLLKAQYGDNFTYESPTPEPQGQPEAEPASEADPVEAAEAEQETQTTPEPEGQPDESIVEWEADGKQYKVPKELEAYLLRDKDYRHKTMTLAEERKAFEAERESVTTMKVATETAFQAATQLGDIMAGVKVADAQLANYQRVDWATLRATDPLEFSNLQHEVRSWQDQRNALIQQFQQAHAKLQGAKLAEVQQALKAAEPIVRKAIPNWGPEAQKSLAEYATGQGYKPEELATLTDPRAVIILNKAYQFDQLQAKQAETKAVVTAQPPVNKSTAPRVSGKEIDLKKAEARYAKTGEQDDLVALLKMRRGK